MEFSIPGAMFSNISLDIGITVGTEVKLINTLFSFKAEIITTYNVMFEARFKGKDTISSTGMTARFVDVLNSCFKVL